MPADATPARTCPLCGGERVNVRLGALGELAAVPFERKHRKWGGRGLVGVSGVGCTSCGHIDLYATDPQRLRGTATPSDG